MSDADALLAAIIAHPDEDMPRLMYADWLDENGQSERAEFIRVQCEYAKLDSHNHGPNARHGHPCDVCERRGAVSKREVELFYSNPAVEPDGVPKSWHVYRCLPDRFDRHPAPSAFFNRGLIHTILCPAADWQAHADAILAQHPIEKVTLTTMPVPRMSGRIEDGLVCWELRPGHDYPVPYEVARGTTRDYVTHLAGKEWPRIAFTLPAEPIEAMRAFGTTMEAAAIAFRAIGNAMRPAMETLAASYRAIGEMAARTLTPDVLAALAETHRETGIEPPETPR